jgi:hypothetical protein
MRNGYVYRSSTNNRRSQKENEQLTQEQQGN